MTKFCKQCQIETDRTKDGSCKPCRKLYHSEWRMKNPDKARINSSAWARSRPEKMAELQSSWAKANPKRISEICAKWYLSNSEKSKSYSAAYAKANPEARRISSHNRRAIKRDNGGILSKKLSAKLFKLQRGICPCCNRPLGLDYHLDHIMPLALGGANADNNMQLLRAICNLQKQAKHPVDFMQSRGFLL